jgi:hypothetical protein
MFSVVNYVSPNMCARRKKRVCVYKRRNQAVLDSPPPPNIIDNDQCSGNYCIKATVELTGKEEKTFIGYSKDMNIGAMTRYACERHKKKGTCGEPQISFSGGDCKEVLFVKPKGGKMTRLFIL